MKLKACIVALVAAGVLTTGAAAYDRAPIPVTGLVADNWGQSTTTTQVKLRVRYPGISADYCVGIKISDDAAGSTWVTGLTRYWDKLECYGYTYTTGKTVFSVTFDTKGSGSQAWIIYRLKGVSIAALRTGSTDTVA